MLVLWDSVEATEEEEIPVGSMIPMVNPARIRRRISGRLERPRLTVFRSLRHFYAQLVDDEGGVTLASASTLGSKEKKTGSNIEAAKEIGAALVQAAQAFLGRHENKEAPNDVAKCLGWVRTKFVTPVTEKYSSFGARDTEPNYHTAHFLIDVAKMDVDGDTDSYRPEWGNWM